MASPGLQLELSCGMSSLSFGSLLPYRTRQFLPQSLDLSNCEEIAPQFDRLEKQAGACRTVADLERWIVDWGELSAVLDEESSRRYIAMTCHTDDAKAEQDYLHFIEHIEPKTKPRQFELEQCFVKHPLQSELPKKRYQVFIRDMKSQVELFRPENVALESEEAKLSQQYQKLMGSLTVQFRGEERTLTQMGKFLEEPDRTLRKEAWTSVAQRRLQESEAVDALFDQLLEVRLQIAKNAGFESYLDYAFRALGRFDYTPTDCHDFHTAVEREVMPLLRSLQSERREKLKLDTLRPWDLSVDPFNRPPLRPFTETKDLVAKSRRVFDQIDTEFATNFSMLQTTQLLDLENRPGKAPGGYQTTLSEARLPFIFMNAVGMQRDVETILHEAGHAFHSLAVQEEDVYYYQHAPIEFCEVASMTMELFGNEHMEVFHSPTDAQRARRMHLEGILSVLPWIATVDAFQHWIYEHAGHTRAERTAAWLEIAGRFGGDVDWAGHADVRESLWHRQLHIFIHPFYYIEYGIAQLGALQIWLNSQENKAGAIADYKRALSLGGSRPLPELFEAAGCRFDFSGRVMKPLVDLIRKELDRLEP